MYQHNISSPPQALKRLEDHLSEVRVEVLTRFEMSILSEFHSAAIEMANSKAQMSPPGGLKGKVRRSPERYWMELGPSSVAC